MEVPKLGVESELELLACATATAVQDPQDPSHICDLHHSSWQCWILNPLSEARDQTYNLMAPNWIRFCCATMGTPKWEHYYNAHLRAAAASICHSHSNTASKLHV